MSTSKKLKTSDELAVSTPGIIEKMNAIIADQEAKKEEVTANRIAKALINIQNFVTILKDGRIRKIRELRKEITYQKKQLENLNKITPDNIINGDFKLAACHSIFRDCVSPEDYLLLHNLQKNNIKLQKEYKAETKKQDDPVESLEVKDELKDGWEEAE